MGKSNNPAKRATQEAAIKTKKSKSSKGAGFLKFVVVMVLTFAIIGPFFAGLTNIATAPATAPVTTTATPAPAVVPITSPATAPATIPAKPTTPAGQ